ncbi:MAG: hypothetical protein RJB38_2026 [Pseudomonadota bacterium]
MAHLFFDLDGTLLDPSEGFTLSLAHAFSSSGLVAPPREALVTAIGPPADEWSAHFGEKVLPSAALPELIFHYREHYEREGLYRQKHYPGLRESLDALLSAGHSLSVATSKPQKQAETVLSHFGLEPLFSGRIFGRDLSQSGDKTTILGRGLRLSEHAPERSIMIGDRMHDGIAARNLGLTSLGVLYGFGSREELESAGVTVICQLPQEIPTCVALILQRFTSLTSA